MPYFVEMSCGATRNMRHLLFLLGQTSWAPSNHCCHVPLLGLGGHNLSLLSLDRSEDDVLAVRRQLLGECGSLRAHWRPLRRDSLVNWQKPRQVQRKGVGKYLTEAQKWATTGDVGDVAAS